MSNTKEENIKTEAERMADIGKAQEIVFDTIVAMDLSLPDTVYILEAVKFKIMNATQK